MRKPFNAGDRVAAYATERYVGTVANAINSTQYMVDVDGVPYVYGSFTRAYHVNQLRLLKPKRKPREFFIEIQASSGYPMNVWPGGDICTPAPSIDNELIFVKEILPRKVKP
jgi:hypothetical protein